MTVTVAPEPLAAHRPPDIGPPRASAPGHRAAHHALSRTSDVLHALEPLIWR